MTLPAPGTGAEVIDAEAVQPFLDRARALRPDITHTEATAPAVAAICVRLDGLPLAIELAASHVTVLSLPALLTRLNQRLPLLTSGPRDQPTRLQTMHAAIAWSDDLLNQEERALFRWLAVFVGGFSRDAVEAIGAAEDAPVLRQLSGLVDHNLAQAGSDIGGENRATSRWLFSESRGAR